MLDKLRIRLFEVDNIVRNVAVRLIAPRRHDLTQEIDRRSYANNLRELSDRLKLAAEHLESYDSEK